MKKLVNKSIDICCNLLKMKRETFLELFLYLFFGVATTCINFIVDMPLRYLLNINVNISITIAWIVSVAFAFATNKIWVFRSKNFSLKSWIKEGVPFVSARILSLFLEIIITFILLEQLGVHQVIVKIICQVVVIVFNYVASKLVIFKKRPIKSKIK